MVQYPGAMGKHPGAMGSKGVPLFTTCEAKHAEERKRDEDWANCLPPIEDICYRYCILDLPRPPRMLARGK